MLLEITDRGLYCEAGDFHIDPWLPVDRAIITHAHGDHARWGSRAYVGSAEGERVMRTRLGVDASIRSVAWGEPFSMNGVNLSLHPAGHTAIASSQPHQSEWTWHGDSKRGRLEDMQSRPQVSWPALSDLLEGRGKDAALRHEEIVIEKTK